MTPTSRSRNLQNVRIGTFPLGRPPLHFALLVSHAAGYTLAMIEKQMVACNEEIERQLGVKATTFAYPCGEKFVGAGVNTQSYVPVAAKLFLAARDYLDEGPNRPARCDLAQTTGMGSDGLTGERILSLVSAAAAQHSWLVLASHEIGPIGIIGPFSGRPGYQTTMVATLEELMKYAADPANGVWLDTVQNIAKYIQARRSGGKWLHQRPLSDVRGSADRTSNRAANVRERLPGTYRD
jgi:hypothetical protein